MILAAGRGERMRPLSDRVPKPLLEVAGRPLVFRLIERLAGCGIIDIVVNVSHLGEQIERALGHGEAFGVRIAYSREREALETAGGIANALPLLGSAPFLAVNADVFSDFNFSRLDGAAARLSPTGNLAHLVLVDNPPHHPEGDFCLRRGTVAAQGPVRLTFSGIGAYHPALFSAIVRGSRYPLTAVLREPIAQGRVSGERHDGIWFDVGTPARLDELRQHVSSGAS